MFDSKARLDAQTFDSIDAMIRAFADEAVLVARRQHGVLLDYTPASVDLLERLVEGQAALRCDRKRQTRRGQPQLPVLTRYSRVQQRVIGEIHRFA